VKDETGLSFGDTASAGVASAMAAGCAATYTGRGRTNAQAASNSFNRTPLPAGSRRALAAGNLRGRRTPWRKPAICSTRHLTVDATGRQQALRHARKAD
jgi:hypothetical protein